MGYAAENGHGGGRDSDSECMKERDKLVGYPATATVMVMASSWACDKRLKEKVSGTMVI